MSTRWARFARGWMAAIFATLVAAVSHGLAGGEAPSILSLVLALAFSGAVCIALTSKKLSATRLTIAVALSQFAFHALFSLIGGGSSAPLFTTGHHGTLLYAADATAGAHAHSTDASMWFGHAVAALITIVTLRYGEASFWRLREFVGLVVRAVLVALRPIGALPRSHRRPAVSFLLPPKLVLLTASLRYRGPPAVSFI